MKLGYRIMAVLVFAMGLAMTMTMWRYEVVREQARLGTEWRAAAAHIASDLQAEYAKITAVQSAAHSLFISSGGIDQADWRNFFDAVSDGAVGAYIKSLRYIEVRSDGSARTVLVEPASLKPQHQGTLLSRYFNLAEAAKKATESGADILVASDQELGHDAETGAWHTVLPVYSSASVPNLVRDRVNQIRGWIVFGFDLEGMMETVAEHDHNDQYAVYYQGMFGKAAPVHDPIPGGVVDHLAELEAHGFTIDEALEQITLGGLTWTVLVLPQTTDYDDFLSDSPTIILSAGLLISVLVTAFLILVSQGPTRAEALAREMTESSRLTEQRAREAEQRLQDAIESMTEGFALWSPDDRLVMANAKYREIYNRVEDLIRPGIAFEDLARAAAERGQHPLGSGGLDAWVEERVRLHRSGSGSYEQALGDGRWILASEYQTRDGGILAIRSDVTDRKNQEAALLDSERRFRDLVECSSDWVWEMDDKITYTYVSPKIRDILGYDSSEVIGSTPFYLMPPGEARRMRQVFETLMEDRLPFADLQNTALHNDGRPVELETSGVPVFGPDGRFVGYRGVARDITQRKSDERVLRESEERFRQISETVPVAVVISKMREHTILYVNDSAAEMMRRHPLTLVGEKLTEVFWSPEDHGKLMDIMRTDGRVENTEIQARGGQGDQLWLLVSAQAVQYEGERAILSASVDITQNKLAQANLIQTSKLATLGEMATGVAHELNQPLAIMKMAVESTKKILGRGDQPDLSLLGEKLTRIDDQIGRATAITDHMRILGRKSTGDQSKIPVFRCLENAIDLMRGQLETAGIDISLEASNVGSAEVLGDPIRLEQVFLNLISNARDAVEANAHDDEAAKRIDVKMDYEAKSGAISIGFRDTGGGMDEDIFDRVFEPFFTTKEVGKGTGLGLSISYSIIDELGGTLEAQNVIGGAEFVIQLTAIQLDDAKTVSNEEDAHL